MQEARAKFMELSDVQASHALKAFMHCIRIRLILPHKCPKKMPLATINSRSRLKLCDILVWLGFWGKPLEKCKEL